MRKAIQPIVEGHGEVDAVPLLLRRLLHEAGVYALDINQPHRKHRVVVANREYEAWFAATMESLRGRRGISADAASHPSPESLKSAKEYVEKRMQSGAYKERTDQPALTNAFDLAVAYRRCRSFRRLVKVVGALVREVDVELTEWPPAAWNQPP